MGNFIVISVFAKLSDPEQTFVEANRTVVSGHFYMRYFSLIFFYELLQFGDEVLSNEIRIFNNFLFLFQLYAHVAFPGSNVFELQLSLHGVSFASLFTAFLFIKSGPATGSQMFPITQSTQWRGKLRDDSKIGPHCVHVCAVA